MVLMGLVQTSKLIGNTAMSIRAQLKGGQIVQTGKADHY